MKKADLEAITQAAAKSIKTEADINEFRQMLIKITVETALNAELDNHLGFDKREQPGTDNSRESMESMGSDTIDKTRLIVSH